MSHDRTGLYYPDFAQDTAKVVASLFAGVRQDMAEQLGDDPQTGNEGGLLSYFNHFLQWEGPVAEGAAGGWTLSDTVGTTTIVLGSARVGEIIITPDATANAAPALALGGAAAGTSFIYAVGKRIWCAARLSIQTVASMEVFFGLGVPDTAPTPANTLPTDGIFFHKVAADTSLSFSARKAGVSTTKTVVAPLVDATYTTIGFQVDKLGNIMPYQEGRAVTGSFIAVGDANIPAAALQFIIGTRGASLVTKLDWVLLAQEI